MTLFQHTAARRRLGRLKNRFYKFLISFNTQPPEGGWGQSGNFSSDRHSFNTQPPEGGWGDLEAEGYKWDVSTHSRPKAAGESDLVRRLHHNSFNTQPPEGGWSPAPVGKGRFYDVSTHSRPKAAGNQAHHHHQARQVSTHSRPKAAGLARIGWHTRSDVSTHSRPKAAGNRSILGNCTKVGFNTQPPEGGWHRHLFGCTKKGFNTQPPEGGWGGQFRGSGESRCFNTQPPEGGWHRFLADDLTVSVSTHSRPKAAGQTFDGNLSNHACFNTQPPEGGWQSKRVALFVMVKFQHTAARRRLGPRLS